MCSDITLCQFTDFPSLLQPQAGNVEDMLIRGYGNVGVNALYASGRVLHCLLPAVGHVPSPQSITSFCTCFACLLLASVGAGLLLLSKT